MAACEPFVPNEPVVSLPPATGLFARPQAVIVAGDALVAGNTRFDAASLDFGDGSITVVSLADDHAPVERPTSKPNPQAFEVYQGDLWVLSSGRTRFLPLLGLNVAEGPGALDRFPLSDLAAEEGPAASIELPLPLDDALMGGFGSLALDPGTGRLWVGSGLSAVVFLVDLPTRALIRGPDDPIRLRFAPEGNDTVALAWHPSGFVLAASFNTNQIFKLDPATSEPIGEPLYVGGTALLEGPLSLCVGQDLSPDVFVLLTHANAVASLELASAKVLPRAYATDAIPNAIALLPGAEPALLVVNSGANSVWRHPLRVGAPKQAQPFATLPPGSNPFGVHASASAIYVSLNLADAVAELDPETGKVRRYWR